MGISASNNTPATDPPHPAKNADVTQNSGGNRVDRKNRPDQKIKPASDDHHRGVLGHDVQQVCIFTKPSDNSDTPTRLAPKAQGSGAWTTDRPHHIPPLHGLETRYRHRCRHICRHTMVLAHSIAQCWEIGRPPERICRSSPAPLRRHPCCWLGRPACPQPHWLSAPSPARPAPDRYSDGT